MDLSGPDIDVKLKERKKGRKGFFRLKIQRINPGSGLRI
jgi:hypothetical protein